MPPRTIAGPAGNLHVSDGGAGTGHPVLFVHSFAGSSMHWRAQLEFLRRTRRALAIDLRGHGQSQAPASGDYSVASFAKDIAAVVDALQLQSVIIVGHSMGGSASIAYAGTHPEHVAGLMLVGTPGRTPAEQSQKSLSAMRADYDRATEGYWNKLLDGAQAEVRERVQADMKKIPREAAEKMIASVFAFDPLKPMRNYPGPCLVVSTPHADTPDALEKQMPDLPVETIEGSSHWMQMDKPGEFNEILADFIDLVQTGESAQAPWHTSSLIEQDYRHEY
jgi:pimeloyl-ACP methyl ester carboxylesterase